MFNVFILGSGELSKQWQEVFISSKANLFNVNFIKYETPNRDWFKKTSILNKSQSIELYNHLLVWNQMTEPAIILNNNSFPVQEPMIILDLFEDSFTKDRDIIMYGRYNENCKHQKDFGIFRSFGQELNLVEPYYPMGGFAYYASLRGANKLINTLSLNVKPINEIIGYYTYNKVLNTLAVSPNAIEYDLPIFKSQCLPSGEFNSNYLILVILVALIIVLLVFSFTLASRS